MSDEIVDFDIDEFLARIHGNKPPFRCPATFCQKICKSYRSIETHMKVHRAPEPIVIPVDYQEDTKIENNDNIIASSRSPASTTTPANNQASISFLESKKFVMLDAVDGGERKNKTFRVNIHQPLKILLDSTAKTNPLRNNEAEKLDLPVVDFEVDGEYKIIGNCPKDNIKGYLHYKEKSEEEMENIIEYDLDEEDTLWLEKINETQASTKQPLVTQETMEWIIDRLEKLSKFQKVLTSSSSSEGRKSLKSTGLPAASAICLGDESADDAVCAVCLDGSCENTNVILFCDVCNLPVHQECYGVPYIPEGSWLCRKCLHSPSEPVQCCLCPNAGGAFKKTSDERWAHVICGLWIPEVVFANLTFLEPLEDIDKIAPARWKLKCFICKKRNSGACIQCHKSTCYRAFHVTCAQQAGLYMKIEDDIKGGGIKKSVFCDIHCPADYSNNPANRSMYANHNESDEESRHSDGAESEMVSECSMMNATKQTSMIAANDGNKMSDKYLSDVRKVLTNKRINQEQAVLVPYVSEASINEMLNSPKFSDLLDSPSDEETRFKILKAAYAFWKLKRALRRGVPLLKRLQASSRNQKLAHLPEMIEVEGEDGNGPINTIKSSSDAVTLGEQSKMLHILRQDLEKARLLSELTKKRERVKRDLFTIFTRQIEIQTQPAKIFLEKIIQILQERDKHNMFAEPVTDAIAPSYSKIIKHPMDFSTMKKKCQSFAYFCVADLAKDFHLMMDNCMTYNLKDSIFYKTAHRLRSYGDEILAEATNVQNRIGINPKTGMFFEDDPMGKPMDAELWKVFAVDNLEHMKQLMNDSCRNIIIDSLPDKKKTEKSTEKETTKKDETPSSSRTSRANRRSSLTNPLETSKKETEESTTSTPESRRPRRSNNANNLNKTGVKRKPEEDLDSSIGSPYATRSAKIPRKSSQIKDSSTPYSHQYNPLMNISQEPTFNSPLTIDSKHTSKEHFRLGHGSISPTEASVVLAKGASGTSKDISQNSNQFKDRPNFQNYQTKAPITGQDQIYHRYSLRETKAKTFPDFNTDEEESSSSSSSSSDEESCFSSEQDSIMRHSVSEVSSGRRNQQTGRSTQAAQNNTSTRMHGNLENEKQETSKGQALGTSPGLNSSLGRQLRHRYSTSQSNNAAQIERSPLSVKNQIIGYSKFAPCPSLLASSHSSVGYKRRRKPLQGVKVRSYLPKRKAKRTVGAGRRQAVGSVIVLDDENTRPLTENEITQDSVLMFNGDSSINMLEETAAHLREEDRREASWSASSLLSSPSPQPLLLDLASSTFSAHSLQVLTPVWAKCLGSPWYPALIMDPLFSSQPFYYPNKVAKHPTTPEVDNTDEIDSVLPTAPKEVLVKGLEIMAVLSRHTLPHCHDMNMDRVLDVYRAMNSKPVKKARDGHDSEDTTIESESDFSSTHGIQQSSLYLVLFFDAKNTWQWLPLDKLKPMFSDHSIDEIKLKQAKRSRMKASILKAYCRALRHICSIQNVPYPAKEDGILSEPFILLNTNK